MFDHVLTFNSLFQIVDPTTGKTFSHSQLRINATESAKYQCKAFNRHLGGQTVKEKSAWVTVGKVFFGI